MELTLGQAMLIYQRVIDKTADAGEGAAWWAEVQAELEAVIAAPTTAAAAALFAWWHQVWKDVGDTPARAASRIRRHAASVLGSYRKRGALCCGRTGQQSSYPNLTFRRRLEHLRSLPFRPSAPVSWDRKHVLDLIREAAGNAPKVDDCVQIGPGGYGIVKPFGVDLAGGRIRGKTAIMDSNSFSRYRPGERS